MARDIRKKIGIIVPGTMRREDLDTQTGGQTPTQPSAFTRDQLIKYFNNRTTQDTNRANYWANQGTGNGNRWNNGNGNPLDNWWNNNGGNTTIKPGSYQNAYSGTINSLINQAINRQPFEWDPATDQAYQAYARMYTRLGEEAGRDTLADVASNTGGLASSYATTASQQARGAYNQALTDKIPELMQLAYDRYRNQYLDLLSGIGTLQGVSDSLYGRYSDQRDYDRGVYESDRDYDRGVYESDRDYDERVRQYNQNYELDKNAQEYERMLNMWTTMGYANSAVAKYFGVPEGTRTDDSQYRWAQYALSQAKSGGGSGGGGGGRRRGSGGGGGGDSYEQSLANAIVAKSGNDLTNYTASIFGGTDNAKEYLARLGQYLAQGNTTGDKQAMAIAQVKNDKNLTANEKLWILQQLSK